MSHEIDDTTRPELQPEIPLEAIAPAAAPDERSTRRGFLVVVTGGAHLLATPALNAEPARGPARAIVSASSYPVPVTESSQFPLPITDVEEEAVRQFGAHVWGKAEASPDWRLWSDLEAVELLRSALDKMDWSRALRLAFRFRREMRISGPATTVDAFLLARRFQPGFGARPSFSIEVERRREGRPCSYSVRLGGRNYIRLGGDVDVAYQLLHFMGIALLCGPAFDPPPFGSPFPFEAIRPYIVTDDALNELSSLFGRAFALGFLEGEA